MRNFFYRFSKALILLPMFFLTFSVNAQNTSITGQVTSTEDSMPLPGVNVFEKGTSNGVVTDFDGNYSITLTNASASLVFSYVGFTTQTVLVDGQQQIDISLLQDTNSLSEVILVGYGSQLKREITGSVQTVKAEELSDIPVSQVTQKLQGRLSGVQINQTTGKPGGGMSVRIRGQLSVSGGSSPLYVIDGFPISGDISDINPDEIEDISILKDAASTSLYGSRAANGVVLITTKKGRLGKTDINFSTSTGMQT
ncbi:MAG: TonB-dependent receptor plug domain-containing protein, partial [Leeuwenhoekiella sp.]